MLFDVAFKTTLTLLLATALVTVVLYASRFAGL